MPYAILLLAAGAAPPPPDVVRLEDVKRFTNITRAEANQRRRLAWLWFYYVREKELEKVTGGDHREVISIYATLAELHVPGDTPAGRMATLRGLRKLLGKDRYRNGVVPPPYLKKYEKDFLKWVDDKKARGLIGPDGRLRREPEKPAKP